MPARLRAWRWRPPGDSTALPSSSPRRRWRPIRSWSRRASFWPRSRSRTTIRRRPREEADKALRVDPESLEALSIKATIDLLDDKPDTPYLASILKLNPAYGEAYADRGPFLRVEPALRGGYCALPQGAGTESESVQGPGGARVEPDAAGPRRRGETAPGSLLQGRQYLSFRGQPAAPAGQLQELPLLQARQHRPQAAREGSGSAGALRGGGTPARHRHLREEVQVTAGSPRPTGSLPGSRGLRRAHPGHAGHGRAGSDLRQCGRHGQPHQPQAGRVSLGQHVVARIEPRLHSGRHAPAHAPLVHRGHGGVRGDGSFAGVGRPPLTPRHPGHPRQEAAARRAARPGLRASDLPGAGGGLLLPGRARLHVH